MHAIIKTFRRAPGQLVQALAQFPVAILADAMGRRGTVDGTIRPLNPGMRVAGSALTVEVRPGDNLMLQASLQLAQPGDVIVVDGRRMLHCALAGGLLVAQARAVGVAGLLIDGAIRDTAELAGVQDFGIFAAGVSANGPTKQLGGRINWPVSFGGQSVSAGDIVVGDADGIVVIGHDAAQDVLQAAARCAAAEARIMDRFDQGHLRPEWVVQALRDAGAVHADEAW